MVAPVLKYHTVVADHSDQIDAISCGAATCTVDFASTAGLNAFAVRLSVPNPG